MVNNRRLFVGGIDECVRSEHLADMFGPHGKIKDIWVRQKSPYFAFVEFEDIVASEKAQKALDGKMFMECILRVEFTRNAGFDPGRGGGEGSVDHRSGREQFRQSDYSPPSYAAKNKRLFVSGFDGDVQSRQLDELFKKFGKIKDIWVGSKSPFFAFVEFYDIDSAVSAQMMMDGKSRLNCILRVEFTKRGGYREGGDGDGAFHHRGGGSSYRASDHAVRSYALPRRVYSKEKSNSPTSSRNEHRLNRGDLYEEYQRYVKQYYDSLRERQRERELYTEFMDFRMAKDRRRGRSPGFRLPSYVSHARERLSDER